MQIPGIRVRSLSLSLSVGEEVAARATTKTKRPSESSRRRTREYRNYGRLSERLSWLLYPTAFYDLAMPRGGRDRHVSGHSRELGGRRIVLIGMA